MALKADELGYGCFLVTDHFMLYLGTAFTSRFKD
jgi:hypothetical protein